MSELRRVLTGLGGEIHEHCPVTRFVRRSARAAGGTPEGEIASGDVVLATGAWTPQLRRELGIRVPVQPGKGY